MKVVLESTEHKGVWVISPVTDDPVFITPAQVRLLEEVGKGKLPTDAARNLGITPSTAFSQFSRMEKHLGTKNWFETLVFFQSKREPSRRPDLATTELADLDLAHKKLVDVMFMPYVNREAPEVVPWLLDAAELVDRARTRINRGPPKAKVLSKE